MGVRAESIRSISPPLTGAIRAADVQAHTQNAIHGADAV
jgi:hypothetical protein